VNKIVSGLPGDFPDIEIGGITCCSYSEPLFACFAVESEAAKEDRPIAQLDRSKLSGRTGQQFLQRFALRSRNHRGKLLLVDEGQAILVAGVCAPLIGSLMGLNALGGECPWCGANVSGVGLFDRFSCPACSRRIVVRKHELIRAE
jgi:DNA-directed RNA polymerase subunit RPC12/RpoP